MKFRSLRGLHHPGRRPFASKIKSFEAVNMSVSEFLDGAGFLQYQQENYINCAIVIGIYGMENIS